MAEGKLFYVVLKVTGSPDVTQPVKAINQESVSHMAAIACATNFPNINGYCIVDSDGKTILENVQAMDFIMSVSKELAAKTGKQVLKAAVPLKGDVSNEEWNKMVEAAREQGKLIGNAPLATPANNPVPVTTMGAQ